MDRPDEKQQLSDIMQTLHGKLVELEKIETDLIRAEEKLTASAMLWQNTFDALPEAICLLNTERQILQCNRAMQEMVDSTAEDIAGLACCRLVHSSDKPIENCPFERMLLSLKKETQVFTLGDAVLEVSVFPNFDVNGVLIGAVHIISDITQRTREIELLEESERKFSSLAEGSNDGIVMLQDGLLKYVNPAAIRMTGYTREELVGRRFIDFVAPEFRELAIERYKKRMAGEDVPRTYEIAITHSDGTVTPVEISASLTTYEGRQADIASVRDITEHKRVKKALKAEKAKVQQYLDIAGVFLVAIDTRGNVVMINKRGCALLGYEEQEIIGKNWFDNFIPNRIKDQVRNVSSKLIKGDISEFTYYENPVITRSGQERLIAWQNTTIIDETGKITGHLSSGVDITDRKMSELKLRENEELLNNVGEIAKIGGWEMDLINRSARWTKGTYDIVEMEYDDDIPGPDEHVEWYLPQYRKMISEAMDRLIEDGQPLDFTAELLTARGNIKWCRAMGRQAEIKNGKCISIRGIFQDITERKLIEFDLTNTQNKLRMVSEHMSDYLMMLDADLKIVYMNKAEQGLSVDHLIGTPLYKLVDRDQQQRVKNILEKVRQTGEKIVYETEYVRPNGTTIYYESIATPIAVDSTISNIVVISRDISDRLNMEQQLQHLLQKYNTHLQKTPVGYIEWGLDFKVRDWNEAAHRIFGYTKEEALDKHATELLLPESAREQIDEVWTNLIANRGGTHSINDNLTKSGDAIICEWNNTTLTDKEGKVMGVASLVQDITSQKESEAEIQSLNSFLLSIRNLNQAIVKENNFDQLLKASCKILTQIQGYTDVSIALIDEASGIIKPKAHYGSHKGKSWILSSGNKTEIPYCIGKLNESKKPLIMKAGDVNCAECAFCTHKASHQSILVPMLDNEIKLLGIISACMQPGTSIHREEIPLFEEIAGDLVFAYRKIQVEQEIEKLARFPSENPNPVMRLDSRGVVLYANSASSDLMKHWQCKNGEKIPANWREKIAEALRSKISIESDIEYDGGALSVILAPIPEMKQVNLYGLDITARKRAEEEVKKLRMAIDQTVDGIVLVNLERYITYANEAFARMHGYEPGELLGRKRLKDFHSSETRAHRGIRQQAESRGFGVAEEVRKRKDGTIFPASVSFTRIHNDSEEVTGYIAVIKDITEQKKAEKERKHMEDQLIISDRLASLGELVSGVAHEVNNPLTSVIGFADMLLDSSVPDSIRGDIEIISKEAHRAADIVRNLLTFARRHPREKSPTDINRAIREIMALRRYEQETNNISVETILEDNLPKVVGNSFELQQVFLNIIINAEYFMKTSHGRGKLTIATSSDGKAVKVAFADNGPGIPKAELPHLFDPFFTTKKVGEGTGLGLSISYGIIQDHGGTISAQNNESGGATFLIELPVLHAA